MKPLHSKQLSLYITPTHECSYLPRREAATIFADPMYPKDPRLQSTLSRQGFRRSGEHLYRPECPDCRACISVRIPVAAFKMRRSQRRTYQKNADLEVHRLRACYREEHFALYQLYVDTRHAGGGMDDPDEGDYLQFLDAHWSDTWFYEFRLHGQLLAVAVVDHLEDALSAVYTFFDPEFSSRSPGAYAVLWQVSEAARLGLRYVYLGYWIKDCRRMSYKSEYQPLEYYIDHRWWRLER